MQVDLGSRRRQPAFKGSILRPHPLPIGADVLHCLDIKAGVALGVAQSLRKRPQTRLAGAPRKRIHGGIHRIDPGIDSSHHRRGANSAGVMGVKVNRQPRFCFQRLDK